MLDKQLAFAEYLHIEPIIVLNKIDLDEKEEFNKISQTYRNIGYKVIKTNAKEKIGIQKLEQELKDNISAFSGNSGVGKSTLINDLFNENWQSYFDYVNGEFVPKGTAPATTTGATSRASSNNTQPKSRAK